MHRLRFALGAAPWRAAAYLLLSLACPAAFAFTSYLGVTGDLAASLRHAWFACLFAPIAPLLFMSVARELAGAIRHDRQWRDLVIDE